MREKKAINTRIGANIKAAREQSEYTQEHLSELLGVTPNHLSAIERGASGASLDTLEKLCGLLGVTVDYLFFGEAATDDKINKLARQLGSVKPEYQPQVNKVLSALLEVLAISEK